MPLGMEDQRILSGQLRASSVYNYNQGPDRGRLNQFAAHSRTGGWMAKNRDKNQWYQIDLEQTSIVKGIATQGRRGAHYWAITYQLSYSQNGAQFKTFVSFGRVKVSGSSLEFFLTSAFSSAKASSQIFLRRRSFFERKCAEAEERENEIAWGTLGREKKGKQTSFLPQFLSSSNSNLLSFRFSRSN